MIERIQGDEAARLFLDHLGLERSGTGLAFLEKLAMGFSRLPYENISKIIKSAEIAGSAKIAGSAGSAGTAEVTGTAGIDGRLECLRLPTEVAGDHIERGFGGTCFSLTFLLERVLRSLGFDAYKVMADMNSGPNVHCLVVVNEGGSRYMIDPGYALYRVIDLPCAPEDAEGEVRVVDFPHAVVQVTAQGRGTYSLWTEDAGGRKRRYVFRDHPVPDSAFETYWLESFSKPTLRNICLTRMTERGHIYLRKDFFKFTSRNSVDRRRLPEGIERLVEAEFGIAGEWTALAREILKKRKSRHRSHETEDRGRT